MASSETPIINSSAKSKLSIRSLVPNFKANLCISKPKSSENNHQTAASSSATTRRNDHHGEDLPLPSEMIPNDLLLLDSALKNHTDHMNAQINLAREKYKDLQKSSWSNEKDFEELRRAIAKLNLQIPTQVNIFSTTNKDDHQGAAVLSDSFKLMHIDLLLVDSAFAKTKEYMDHMSVKINQAHEKFKELQTLRSSPERVSYVTPKGKRDFDELRKAIKKLKVQIPSHVKIRCADSNRHPYQWPDINGAEDGMTHFFYKEPHVPGSGDSVGLILKAFRELPQPILPICLLCFFKFPPEATIKRTTMIYLWIGMGCTCFLTGWGTNEDCGGMILDGLVERGFIQPIYQNCSLVPDSYKMSLSVRSALYCEALSLGFTSSDELCLDRAFVSSHECSFSCLVNVGEAIINWDPKISVSVNYVKSLYLGRWQSSATHHIELADTKILHGLKNMKCLKFLSLRGISMITELPTSMLELDCLEILDLRDCHNLEVIPDNIGLLKRLTHLDMSGCYFVEHMPKSLSQLSNLEVLKGFLIGDFNKTKQSCTLSDLSRMPKLRKLNIYISVKDFRTLWGFDDLKNFEVLQKLTISWGGCSSQGASRRQSQGKASTEQLSQVPLTLPRKLQKLDLQGYPTESLTNWLRPGNIPRLKKLYIRGGHLCDLGQSRKHQWEHWDVEILRLRYLSELDIDWSELRELFPKLIYLHQVDCRKLRNFPCDESGVWMDKNDIYIQEQLQKYSRTWGISSSSMDSGPTFDQDDYNSRDSDPTSDQDDFVKISLVE